MREAQAKAILLKDYAPPAFLIERVALDIEIRADDALVKASLAVRRNPASQEKDAPLILDGDELQLISLLLNQQENPARTEVFGCVTTGEAWQFLHLCDAALSLDRQRYYIDNVGAILAVIQAIIAKVS